MSVATLSSYSDQEVNEQEKLLFEIRLNLSEAAVSCNWTQNSRLIWEFRLCSLWLQGSRDLPNGLGFYFFLTVVNDGWGFCGSTVSFEFVLLTSILWLVVFSCIWNTCSLTLLNCVSASNWWPWQSSVAINCYITYLLFVAQTPIQWEAHAAEVSGIRKESKSIARIMQSSYAFKKKSVSGNYNCSKAQITSNLKNIISLCMYIFSFNTEIT